MAVTTQEAQAKKSFTVKLDSVLIRRMKAEAAIRGIKTPDFVTEAMNSYLATIGERMTVTSDGTPTGA